MLIERLTRAVKDALAICRAEDLVPDVGVPVEVVAQAGAYATNAPLLLARRSENAVSTAGARAGVYAEHLAENINAHPDTPAVAKALETGTLLLYPSSAVYAETVRAVLAAGDEWGTNKSGGGSRALVEFVSANPNTPLSLHHARGAAVGDAMCHLLWASGYTVEREFYVNDAASAQQLRSLARAVFGAYREHFGVAASEITSEGYSGEYVTELAKKIGEASGDRYVDLSPEAAATALTPLVVSLMQAEQEETLVRFGVRFDRWFSEATLLAGGALQNVLDTLLASGAAYAHGGALWLKTTQYGDDGDRVLLRNDGTPSYFAGDLAYHADKLQARAYDLTVDVWNADHQPYIGRTMAGLAALGVPNVEHRLRIAVFGTVRALQDGSELRTGRYASGVVTLKEILDAGSDADALRFALLLASPTSVPMDLSVDALAPSAPNNPLTGVRAALAKSSAMPDTGDADLGELKDNEALSGIIRRLDMFPDTVRGAATTASPAEVARFAWSLADAVNRLPESGDAATSATIRAAGVTLQNALRLLGIAPA
ncbi:MAG: arginine--tRNA ligase [Akkermansiaceae bacterium]|nr:arginine--tRNA ligase [Armatimonadota bacterium]